MISCESEVDAENDEQGAGYELYIEDCVIFQQALSDESYNESDAVDDWDRCRQIR